MKCDCSMGRAGRILDPTSLRVPTEGRGLAASPGKEERRPGDLWRMLEFCERHLGVQSSESTPMRVHTHPLSIKALPPPPILGLRAHGVVCSLSGRTSAGMPSWCSKVPVTPEPSLVKEVCQWQEESQADPLLIRQPLDVGSKSEVLGGPREAWADDRVCVCPPGPDTPENTSCSRVDAWPPLAVVTPGDRAGEGQCAISGCPQEVDRWSRQGSRAVT